MIDSETPAAAHIQKDFFVVSISIPMVLTKSECRDRVVDEVQSIDYTESSGQSHSFGKHGELTEVDTKSTPFSHIYEWKNNPLIPMENQRYSYGIVDDRKITEDSLDHVVDSFIQLYNEVRLGAKRHFERATLILIAFTKEMNPELQTYIENTQSSDFGYFEVVLFVIECDSKTPFYNEYGKGLQRHLHNFQKKTIRSVFDPALNG